MPYFWNILAGNSNFKYFRGAIWCLEHSIAQIARKWPICQVAVILDMLFHLMTIKNIFEAI